MIAERPKLTVAIALVVLLLLGIGAWLLTHRPGAQPPQTSPTPSPSSPSTGDIDLSGWKLTLPVEGDSGKAKNVEPAQATDPWLTWGAQGLTFTAPLQGATTANSSHPRTELINLTDFTAGDSGQHTLRAQLTVDQTPADTGDVIIGQIHGSADLKSVAYVMLHYTNGTIRVVVKQTHERGDSAAQKVELLTGVAPGQPFEFTITDTGAGQLTFTASSKGVSKQASAPVPEAFAGQPVRFQVGDYPQSDTSADSGDGSDSSDTGDGSDPQNAAPSGDQVGGRVTFSHISAD